jgi:hypothetical protein
MRTDVHTPADTQRSAHTLTAINLHPTLPIMTADSAPRRAGVLALRAPQESLAEGQPRAFC